MSAPIRVAIRADAGPATGTGHFARAAAVADALAATGADVLLVTGTDGEALVPSYFPANTRVLVLPQSQGSPASAMAAMQEVDWSPEAIYLDQYGSVAEWETESARAGVPLVVLDDLDAATDADVIIRPHAGQEHDARSTVLQGPAFLPLSRHVVSQSRSARLDRPADRPRLNVCFGGSDPTNETAKALEAIAALSLVDADVVIGPGSRIGVDALGGAEKLPHVAVHRAPSQEGLAALLHDADFALGAGGVMLWERLCLGVPSLVIAIADNQKPQIERMSAAGAIRFIGDHDEVTAQEIAEAVSAFAQDRAAREVMAERGRRLVDGRGAIRLAAWLNALALRVRDVAPSDARDLFEWRMDERNWQHNWDDSEKPDFAEHRSWLSGKLSDPNCVFRLVMRGDEPVGVVRFDLGDQGRSAYLSIYLVPAWHGRKMGLAVYCAAERALRQSHPAVREVVSRIHRHNMGSARLHEDAAFDIAPLAARPDWLEARKPLG